MAYVLINEKIVWYPASTNLTIMGTWINVVYQTILVMYSLSVQVGAKVFDQS